jgi:phosphoglycolate phosphatase-like HAD superfamily hydrolase
MKAVIFSEEALADTGRLFADAVDALARKLGRVKPLDVAALPADHAAAVDALARWGDGDVSTWELELGRFYDDHVPLYLRPDAALNATVRRLEREGVRLGAWSPGPQDAAGSVIRFLGLTRRLEAVRVDRSADAPVALAAELGFAERPDDVLAVSADAGSLTAARRAGLRTAAALWTGTDRRALMDVIPTYLAESPGDLVTLALEGRMPVTR